MKEYGVINKSLFINFKFYQKMSKIENILQKLGQNIQNHELRLKYELNRDKVVYLMNEITRLKQYERNLMMQLDA